MADSARRLPTVLNGNFKIYDQVEYLLAMIKMLARGNRATMRRAS